MRAARDGCGSDEWGALGIDNTALPRYYIVDGYIRRHDNKNESTNRQSLGSMREEKGNG